MKDVETGPVLVIVLHNGTLVEIPNLEPSLVEQVFEAHTKYVEQETKEPQVESLKTFEPTGKQKDLSFSFGIPFQMSGGEGAEGLGSFLQHNPEQANSPEVPPEVIKKVLAITKALGMDIEKMELPKAEPHCNCSFCQLSRALHNGIDEKTEEAQEEEITEEDLRFRDWDIKQKGDKLYVVSNPLEPNEHYQVYLGNPVGCTCGEKNCEHIRTVLNS